MTSFRRLLSLASATVFAASLALASELTWDFIFAPSDVSLDPVGEYTLVSLADGANPRDAIGAPAIPAKFANILLPDGATDVSVAATGDLVLLASDITPYPVQRVAPKSKPLPPFTAPDADAYASADPWPSAVATFEGVHEMQGSTFVSVRVNPLVYVASEKALYYRPIVSVTVSYATPSVAPRSSRSVSQNALATEMVNALVVNPEAADSPSAVRRRAAARASTVDYLIITSSGLSSAFQNLADYRASAAGGAFKTLVVTTNDIASSYSGDDIQMKIRNCISNYVKNSGTTYVVLGGDDKAVPDRDCYAYVSDEPAYEYHMPTDLYYSDLTGTWKSSGNTNFGVVKANVDMSPDVIVGRIPVRTAAQLSGYLAKVQAFEADTSHTRNSIIMGGPAAWGRYYGNKRPSDNVTGDGHAAFRASNRTYVSDSEMWNRRLFRDGIKPYWQSAESSITMKIACDSITSWDSSTCGDKVLSASNLKTWLNNGYTHFMFSGHGYPQGWGMEANDNYSSTQAASQTGLVAFVYTDACLTGAFDDDGIGGAGTITVDASTDPYKYTSEPCLGEAFIRNADGGALVHMGCARYGWGSADYQNSDTDEKYDGCYTNWTASNTSDGGPSTVYAYKFYKRLYESAAVNSNRTVGAAFAMSKADMISQCSSDGCERWIQYGLNYLGDPAITLYPRVIPDAAPVFDSSTAVTNGYKNEAIYFDFSELLTAGSPAPTYTVSTSVSSSLYEWADGLLAFTPSTTGTYTFTCTASNSSGTATCTLTVTVTEPPPATPEVPSTPPAAATTSFTAAWSAVADAASYKLYVQQKVAPATSARAAGDTILLSEDFTAFNSSSYSTTLASQTVDSGTWSYESVMMTPGGAANGDGSKGFAQLQANNGKLYLPPVDDPGSLSFTARTSSGSVTLQQQISGEWTTIGSWDLTSSGAEYTHVFTNAGSAAALRFLAGGKATYIHDVTVFGSSDTWVDIPGSPFTVSATSKTVSGLSADTEYRYSVTAVNAAGVESEPSSYVPVTTAAGDSAPVISVPQTAYTVTVGAPDVDFTVTVTGSPAPTVTATCTEGAYFVFEDNEFLFEPATVGTYHFVFTATNSEGSDSETVTIVVSAAPVTVPTLLVGDETATTAYATWDECTGVSSYTLQLASDDQFTTGGGSGGGESVELVNEGFDGGTTLPTGWTVESGSIGGTYTSGGNYGVSSPSLQLKSSVTFSTPALSNPTNVSFWYKGNGSSFTSTLVVEQLVGGTWSEVDTAAISGSADTFSHALDSSATQVRFVFTKNSGNVAFDDVVITGTSGSSGSSGEGSLILETTVADTEYTFTGLTPFTVYYARVKGNADWSNVEEFTTDSAGDSAPVWSTIPPISVTVGDVIPNFYPANYVHGTPAPTITLSTSVSTNDYEFDDGLLMFQPLTIGSFGFTFTANNGIGSPASATLTVNSTGSVPVVSVPQTSCSTSLGGADVDFYVTATGTPTPTLALSDTTATSGYDFDPDDGYFTFIPYATGTFTFTFTATSLAGSNSVTVTVTVTDAAVTVPTLTVTNVTDTTALATWTACDGVSSYTLQLSTNEFSAGAATITDTLTAAKLGLGGSYGAGSYASGDSGAEYAAYGMTKSGGTAIQIRSNDSQSGIVVTKSPGSVTEVRVTFESSTASNRTLNVYGSASAYSSAADLYSASTPLGTIVYDGSNATGTYTINGSYAFIGIRSASGAIYLDNVEIDWTPANGGTTSKGLAKDGGDGIQTFTVNDTEYEFTGLAPESTYYARVKGTSDWSNVETFTTLAGADSAPVWSAIPAQNYLFGSNNGTFEFNVAPYASGSPSPAFYLGDTQWTAYVDDGNGDFIFEPEALGTFDFTVIASNTLGTANATLSVTVTAAPPAFVGLPATTNGYAGEDVTFTVVASGNPAPVLGVDADDGLLFTFNDSTGEFMFNSDNTGDFEFEFTAANIAATVTQTVTVTISAAPVTVPVLTVTNVTATTALATWTACDGVTEYTLQLSTNDFPAASGASRDITTLLSESFESGIPTTWSKNNVGTATGKGGDGDTCLAFKGVGAYVLIGGLESPSGISFMYKRSGNDTAWGLDLYVGSSADGPWTPIGSIDSAETTWNNFATNFTASGTSFIKLVDTRTTGSHERYLDLLEITAGSSGGGDDPVGDDVQEFRVADTSYQFTDLTPYTVYYARVKGNSYWSGTEQFITEEEPVTGTAPSWSALPDDASVVADGTYELDLSAYVSGDAPITFTLAETELEADVVDSNFIFYPAATGTPSFTFTASNAFGTADATLTVTVTGEAPAVIVTPATYSYEVNVGDPYVEFTVTASGHPVPTLSDSCTEGAYYIFENNAFLFDPDTAGTYHFVFTASNSEGEDSKTVTVTVSGGEPPLTAFQQWLADNGYGEHAEGEIAGNGQTYFENYIADIDPRTTNELAIVFSNGQFIVDNASENRWYQFIYSTNLKDGFANTNALGKPDALPLVIVPPDAANWFGRIKVTVDEPTAP